MPEPPETTRFSSDTVRGGPSAAQDRFATYREKAERRGRIRHPEGDSYETPDWLDVLVLLDEIGRLQERIYELTRGREGRAR